MVKIHLTKTFYPDDVEYYVSILFNDVKLSKKQNTELSEIIDSSMPKGRGDPKLGLSYIPTATEGNYAVTFENSSYAIEFYKKLIDKEYIKELRMGKIEYVRTDKEL